MARAGVPWVGRGGQSFLMMEMSGRVGQGPGGAEGGWGPGFGGTIGWEPSVGVWFEEVGWRGADAGHGGWGGGFESVPASQRQPWPVLALSAGLGGTTPSWATWSRELPPSPPLFLL